MVPMNDSRLRVAVLVHGGVEREFHGVFVPFVVDIIRHLAESFDITVYTFASGPDPVPADGLDGIEVRFLGGKPGRSSVSRYLVLAWNLALDHQRRRYGLFHGIWLHPSGLIAAWIGRLLSVPSIVSFHGAETACIPSIGYGHARRRLHRLILRRVTMSASAVTVLSRHQLAALRGIGIRREDVHIVEPAADPEAFRFHADGGPNGIVRLIHVANLTPVKDQEMLLRAMRTIRDAVPATLTCIGADYMDGRLQKLAGELGLAGDVSFKGYVAHAQLPGLYHGSDFLLVTSMHEAGGVAVAEALASGTIVCGTRVGLVSDLEGDCTVAVPVGDHRALSAAVLRLAADTSLYRQLQENGRRWAERHSIRGSTERFRALYLSSAGEGAV